MMADNFSISQGDLISVTVSDPIPVGIVGFLGPQGPTGATGPAGPAGSASNTDGVPEGSTNLYFTNARAVAATQSALDGKLAAPSITTTKTAAYTAAVAEVVMCNASSGGFTVTMPTGVADKSRIIVKKIDSSTNIVTVVTSGSDVFNSSGSGVTSLTLPLMNQALTAQYQTSTGVWIVINTDIPLTQTDARYLNQNTTGTAAGITGKTTPTGQLVGTSDAQALTNKTLDATNTFPTFNQNTTGSAAKLTTARTINGIASFDGSANISTNNTGWQPADQNLLAWNFDYGNVSGNTQLTAGNLYLMGIKIPSATTITNVVLWVAGAGSSLTSGQCFAGLYQNGTLIGSTADQSTAWQTAGIYQMPLVGGPYSVSAGTVYVGFYYRGSTSPGFVRSGTGFTAGALNVNLSSNNYRSATANTGLTTALPSTLGTQSTYFVNHWAAVS
jgi:hypothetical protein